MKHSAASCDPKKLRRDRRLARRRSQARRPTGQLAADAGAVGGENKAATTARRCQHCLAIGPQGDVRRETWPKKGAPPNAKRPAKRQAQAAGEQPS